ncbi:MAG: hypothetical protein C0631_02690 [Sedimenticola sp.]|nr:MAG: hypothetical protein C0631_02690 [Sedimenticola sp.]
MRLTRKWAVGKPPLLALVATQFAFGAPYLSDALKSLKNSATSSYRFDLPNFHDWFKLYRSHRKSNDFIRGLFSEFSSFSPESISFAEELAELTQSDWLQGKKTFEVEFSKLSPEDKQREIRNAQHNASQLLQESFKDLEEDTYSHKLGDIVAQNLLERINGSIIAGFYFLVFAPCWLLYRQHPSTLYRNARLGDYTSLEKLLRLDPLTIHDPAIGKQVQKLRLSGKKYKYDNLLSAVGKGPRKDISHQRMEHVIAGLISAISDGLNHPLRHKEIAELFDAVSVDLTLKKHPVNHKSSAFSKAIQRERRDWMEVLRLDNKN